MARRYAGHAGLDSAGHLILYVTNASTDEMPSEFASRMLFDQHDHALKDTDIKRERRDVGVLEVDQRQPTLVA